MILEDDLHLAEFCRAARPRLEALARFLTKGSEVDAEDLTQDTLHVFVHKWKNGMTVADPEKYADGILRKLAKRALQKNSEQRRRQVPLEEAGDSSTPDVATAVEERAKYELLHKAVIGVPNRRQRDFLAWSLEGASIPEIAEREFKQSGRRSSSHQVSCVLDRGRGQLSASYKRRGGWRVVLPPLPMFGSLRRRMIEIGTPIVEATHSVAFAALVNAVAAIALTFPGAVSIESVRADERLNSSFTKGNIAPKALPYGEVVSSPTVEAEPRPAVILEFGDASTGFRQKQSEQQHEPPAGPEAWLMDIVGHPERLLPQCGGLPICGSP